jgi:hypothetical protein
MKFLSIPLDFPLVSLGNPYHVPLIFHRLPTVFEGTPYHASLKAVGLLQVLTGCPLLFSFEFSFRSITVFLKYSPIECHQIFLQLSGGTPYHLL